MPLSNTKASSPIFKAKIQKIKAKKDFKALGIELSLMDYGSVYFAFAVPQAAQATGGMVMSTWAQLPYYKMRGGFKTAEMRQKKSGLKTLMITLSSIGVIQL